jgi:predicted ATPase
VLMIFEDAHWTDPTSLEAFSRIVDRIRTLRALLIVTYRPEFGPPWIGRPHVTAVTLNRLGDPEIAAMIEGVIGNKPLTTSIRKEIIERTDGIPLFVEEITKSVLEAVGEGMTERAGAGVLTPSVAVPASLHASLMARLDRLCAAKEIAQIGAAIGREFPHALLRAVASKPEVALAAALDRLLAAGLLFREGVPPHATICSSTPWYRTRPTARCCVSRDAPFTPASPKHSKANCRRSPRTSRSCWPVTAQRPA